MGDGARPERGVVTPKVVSNSSPLIALNQIGHLSLLRDIFNEIVIPPAVRLENASSVALPEWISERAPAQPIGPRILRASLGAGESEAITLGLEMEANWVVLDDRPAPASRRPWVCRLSGRSESC